MPSINLLAKIIVNILLIILLANLELANAKTNQIIDIAYLTQEQVAPLSLSNLDPFIKNKGVLGAELGIDDDNTTGKFVGQQFNLKKIIVPMDGNVIATFDKEISKKFQYVVINLSATQVNQVADLPEAKKCSYLT